MKKQCLCCQFVCDDDLHCCPMCGQGSWVVIEDHVHVLAEEKPKKAAPKK